MTSRVYSVTQWINSPLCRQPKGGFIPKSLLRKTVPSFKRNTTLFPFFQENINPSVIGLVVDYLTRWVINRAPDSFKIPERGLKQAVSDYITLKSRGKIEEAKKYLGFIIEGKAHLDNLCEALEAKAELQELIPLACLVTPLDAYFRSGRMPSFSSIEKPNSQTIHNIYCMVSRTVEYLSTFKKGNSIQTGVFFTGKNFAIPKHIKYGDGDFMTGQSLVELKTSKKEDYCISPAATLQGFIYYLLGKESGDERFFSIKEICFYNPRLNMEWSLDISLVSQQTIEFIKSQW